MDGWKKLNLATLNKGAALEIFDRELGKVIENISDINTMPKEKRTITIEISIVPDERREVGSVNITSKTKLAPLKPISSSIAFQENSNGLLTPFESEMTQMDFKFDNNVSSIAKG